MILKWDRTKPFTIDVIVRPDRIDGYGHVSNHCYLAWMTDCMFAHSASVGLDASTCASMARGMAVKDMRAEFISPAYEGDKLTVGNWIIYSDRKLRASRRFQIINSDSGNTIARAEMDFICTNLENGRPVRMPEIFKERYVVDSEKV